MALERAEADRWRSPREELNFYGGRVCRAAWNKSIIFLIVLGFLASSCAPEALPRTVQTPQQGQIMQRAERASKAADEALRAAQAERERSQKLLEEAQSLSARAAEAEARCADSVRRVEGVEAARKKAVKAQAKKRAAEQAVIEAAPAATPVPEPTRNLDYSPSDAPVGGGLGTSKSNTAVHDDEAPHGGSAAGSGAAAGAGDTHHGSGTASQPTGTQPTSAHSAGAKESEAGHGGGEHH